MARTFAEQSEYLAQQYPEFRDAFMAMRGAARAAGPLDTKTQELINTAVYAVSQSEGGTRAHSARAYQAGASPAEIRQAILLCLGLGMGFSHTYVALDWVRESLEAAGAKDL